MQTKGISTPAQVPQWDSSIAAHDAGYAEGYEAGRKAALQRLATVYADRSEMNDLAAQMNRGLGAYTLYLALSAVSAAQADVSDTCSIEAHLPSHEKEGL